MGVPYAEVIGDPIVHSKSPLVHEFWLKKLHLSGRYRATQVTPAELPAYLAERIAEPEWQGCNLTMPLKRLALDHADAIDGTAEGCGAANCLFRRGDDLVATNTDLWGLLASLSGWEPRGPAVVIGTGGAARAALAMFQRLHVGDVHVVGRDRAGAIALLRSFGLTGRGWSIDAKLLIGRPRLLINATPLGMAGGPPMPANVLELLRWMEPDATVLDMIYEPERTALLGLAAERDLRSISGLTMLVNQASKAFQCFFGVSPGTAHDEELYRLLAR